MDRCCASTECCELNEICCEDECEPGICGVALTPASVTAVRGQTVTINLQATCSPECGEVDWTIESESDQVIPTSSAGRQACPDGPEAVEIQITCDAPLEPVELTLTGSGPATNGGGFQQPAITVTGPDMDGNADYERADDAAAIDESFGATEWLRFTDVFLLPDTVRDVC